MQVHHKSAASSKQNMIFNISPLMPGLSDSEKEQGTNCINEYANFIKDSKVKSFQNYLIVNQEHSSTDGNNISKPIGQNQMWQITSPQSSQDESKHANYQYPNDVKNSQSSGMKTNNDFLILTGL
jgi:hypothetical protein